MPVDEDEPHGGPEGHPVRQPQPDIRPLGCLALALAVLSLLFAVSYLFCPLTYLVAALAIPLGGIARGDEPIRTMGTTAVVVAVVAIICATAVLVLP